MSGWLGSSNICLIKTKIGLVVLPELLVTRSLREVEAFAGVEETPEVTVFVVNVVLVPNAAAGGADVMGTNAGAVVDGANGE